MYSFFKHRLDLINVIDVLKSYFIIDIALLMFAIIPSNISIIFCLLYVYDFLLYLRIVATIMPMFIIPLEEFLLKRYVSDNPR